MRRVLRRRGVEYSRCVRRGVGGVMIQALTWTKSKMAPWFRPRYKNTED